MLRARRRGVNATTWPGFVDAMTGLLLVLMFVLTIFTVVQFTLRDQISGQQSRLDELAAEVATLSDALGLSRSREAELSQDLSAATEREAEQASLIDALTRERDMQAAALSDAQGRITGFEAQVAGLLAERAQAEERVAALEARTAAQAEEAEALNLALAAAREEISAGEEQARLAAARREALEMLVRSLQNDTAEQGEALAEAEALRLADAAAAEALRERLENSGAELTAMTLALEEERREAEETLTLLAAAEAARKDLDLELAAAETFSEEALSESERQAALLAIAQARLAEEEELSAESQRQVAALNAQVADLRRQVGTLQALLDLAAEEDTKAQVQIESLGQELNTALARVAAEERRRAELEEAERLRLSEEAERLAAQAQDLESYKSEFFGNMRRLLEGREGIQVVGDRFVFSSEVLFPPGSATLSEEGQAQISRVASLLREIAADVPPGIDWVIQVDGHTDNLPITEGREFSDNWELSQARALSVVRQMSEAEGIPPERLSANGYGEFQPLDTSGTPEGQARNRRIEIKLTER